MGRLIFSYYKSGPQVYANLIKHKILLLENLVFSIHNIMKMCNKVGITK